MTKVSCITSKNVQSRHIELMYNSISECKTYVTIQSELWGAVSPNKVTAITGTTSAAAVSKVEACHDHSQMSSTAIHGGLSIPSYYI